MRKRPRSCVPLTPAQRRLAAPRGKAIRTRAFGYTARFHRADRLGLHRIAAANPTHSTRADDARCSSTPRATRRAVRARPIDDVVHLANRDRERRRGALFAPRVTNLGRPRSPAQASRSRPKVAWELASMARSSRRRRMNLTYETRWRHCRVVGWRGDRSLFTDADAALQVRSGAGRLAGIARAAEDRRRLKGGRWLASPTWATRRS